MSKTTASVYEFAYRGMLTEEALDRAGRTGRNLFTQSIDDIDDALNFQLLDLDELEDAERMARVYAAIALFENASRKFIAKILQGEHGDKWWDERVSEKIKKFSKTRQEEEDSVKWHGTRGDDPLTYTEMKHLASIIEANWEDFQPHVRRLDWAKSIFSTIERSRNVIMHSGKLSIEDIERVGMNIRDWVKQVGT